MSYRELVVFYALLNAYRRGAAGLAKPDINDVAPLLDELDALGNRDRPDHKRTA